MENERRFPLILSSFWLKIIALVTMTFDHVGLVFYIEPFRYIGRLALPLFCLMIVEGVIHTHNFKKYALRLGVMASAISIIIILTEVVPLIKNNGGSMKDAGVIFIDLLLGAVAIFCLKQKKWYIKLLALLPLAYGITSYMVSCHDACGCNGEVLWFPYFLRTQYGWFGITLIVGFYFAHLLGRLFVKSFSAQSGTDPARILQNFGQTGCDQTDPLKAPLNGIRMGVFSFVIEHAFDTVDQGVQSSGHSEFLRHGPCEIRPDEGSGRDDRLFHDEFLDPGFGIDDVRIGSGFRPGSGGSGHADDPFEFPVREFLRSAVDAEKFLNIHTGLKTEIGGFGGIHDAASADGYDFLGLEFFNGFAHFADIVHRGFGRNALPVHGRHTAAAQFFNDSRQTAVPGSGTGSPAENERIGFMFFQHVSADSLMGSRTEKNHGVRIFVDHGLIPEFDFRKFHFFPFSIWDRR